MGRGLSTKLSTCIIHFHFLFLVNVNAIYHFLILALNQNFLKFGEGRKCFKTSGTPHPLPPSIPRALKNMRNPKCITRYIVEYMYLFLFFFNNPWAETQTYLNLEMCQTKQKKTSLILAVTFKGVFSKYNQELSGLYIEHSQLKYHPYSTVKSKQMLFQWSKIINMSGNKPTCHYFSANLNKNATSIDFIYTISPNLDLYALLKYIFLSVFKINFFLQC